MFLKQALQLSEVLFRLDGNRIHRPEAWLPNHPDEISATEFGQFIIFEDDYIETFVFKDTGCLTNITLSEIRDKNQFHPEKTKKEIVEREERINGYLESTEWEPIND